MTSTVYGGGGSRGDRDNDGWYKEQPLAQCQAQEMGLAGEEMC